MVEDRSFLSPEHLENPYPYFHRLRADDPVHWSDHHRAWVLTRYDDVAAAARDRRLSSERIESLLPAAAGAEERAGFSRILRLLANWMVFKDPPAHGRLRRLGRAAFATRTVEKLRPTIRETVDAILRRLAAQGEFDFVRDFAFALPATVIARMLGVPEGDQERFRGWSEDIEPIVFGSTAPAADRREQAKRGLGELEAYFRQSLDRYQREPADNLLTALARAEEEGDVLSADEVIATCILFLFGGHETTTNLIGSGFHALHQNPAERRRLVEHPELVPLAVEEFLRFESPQSTMLRLAAEPLELRGRRIERGSRVFLVLGAANRDPERFLDPDRLDVGREPNDHLSFGYGIHHCLGAPLARLEGEVVFQALVDWLPRLRVTVERPEWQPQIVSRGLKSLPVVVD